MKTIDRDPLIIAIDGPAGSGKSSVAAALAKKLSLPHIDTGAMYRVLTWKALDKKIPLGNGQLLACELREMHLHFEGGHLFLDSTDCEQFIRSDEVTSHVSEISAHAEVREAMVEIQRILCWESSVGAVMEGRDIGSVVLPLACCKIYLDAGSEERAKRRLLQLGRESTGEHLEEMKLEIERRDYLDSTRENSPLLISPDARVLNTDELTLEQVSDRCAEFGKESFEVDIDKSKLSGYRFWNLHYRLSWLLVTNFMKIVFGLKVFGARHQDSCEVFLYSCNHINNADPIVVGGGINREICFLAKKELFFFPLAQLIHLYNGIAINRRGFDARAFKKARQRLLDGKNVMIFPEGTRKKPGFPGPVKKGLGILALMADCAYVPCFVRGSASIGKALLRLEPLEVWVGPPVHLHAVEKMRETMDDKTISGKIGDLYLQQLLSFQARSNWLQSR